MAIFSSRYRLYLFGLQSVMSDGQTKNWLARGLTNRAEAQTEAVKVLSQSKLAMEAVKLEASGPRVAYFRSNP